MLLKIKMNLVIVRYFVFFLFITLIAAETLQVQNAILALQKEKEYEKLSKDDICIPGTIACIKGDRAECDANGKFIIKRCDSKSLLRCYIFPLSNEFGTSIVCG
jgi:hypothetical protein